LDTDEAGFIPSTRDRYIPGTANERRFRLGD
jgi:hypothetical protein